MYQTLGIVMLVLSVFGLVVIGLFCLSVIVEILEERSKMCNGGGEATPLDGMKDEKLRDHVRKKMPVDRRCQVMVGKKTRSEKRK